MYCDKVYLVFCLFVYNMYNSIVEKRQVLPPHQAAKECTRWIPEKYPLLCEERTTGRLTTGDRSRGHPLALEIFLAEE